MSGSLFELLAAVVESWASGPGPAIPKVARILSASSPLPWVASQRGDSGRLKRRTQTISAHTPMSTKMPRQPSDSLKTSAKIIAAGQGNAPPPTWTSDMLRPRTFFGENSAA